MVQTQTASAGHDDVQCRRDCAGRFGGGRQCTANDAAGEMPWGRAPSQRLPLHVTYLQPARRTASMNMPTPPEALIDPQLPSPPGPSAAVSFARGLWRVAAADVSAGNRPVLLRDGAAAFDAMIAGIEGARHTLDFECYIFRGGDEVGQRV